MIRSLRTKFICITMLLLSLLLAAILAVTGYNTVNQQIRMQENALVQMLRVGQTSPQGTDVPGETPPAFPEDNTGRNEGRRGNEEDYFGPRHIDRDGGPSGGMGAFTPSILLLSGTDGSVTTVRQQLLTLSDEAVEDVTQTVLESGKTSGTLSSYGLRYRTQTTDAGTLIALADRSAELEVLKNTLLSSGAIFAGAFLALLLITWLLARWALRPVEEAWEKQRQFVADASHELRTPLTVILANTGLLASHKDRTIQEEYRWIESTQEEAGHMKHLVDDLLFLARSDAQKLPVKAERTDLSEIVTGALLSLEPVAFERGISLQDDIEPDAVLTGDPAQLRQLAVILLDNACKYADGNEVSVRLKKENGQFVLSVANPGKDLSPDQISHLFDRFYRADSARTREGAGGYGLGLPIARTIVQAHGGKISARSEGGIITFTVTLPAQA
ncbi:MAG: two-component sensor histidine kinase [Lachnospiraceae bacterium]|nr:two-component sensor histidine kinase [Lachnospiraceae bacterium]